MDPQLARRCLDPVLTEVTEFKAAENNGVPFAVILGEEELANGQVKYVTDSSNKTLQDHDS